MPTFAAQFWLRNLPRFLILVSIVLISTPILFICSFVYEISKFVYFFIIVSFPVLCYFFDLGLLSPIGAAGQTRTAIYAPDAPLCLSYDSVCAGIPSGRRPPNPSGQFGLGYLLGYDQKLETSKRRPSRLLVSLKAGFCLCKGQKIGNVQPWAEVCSGY